MRWLDRGIKSGNWKTKAKAWSAPWQSREVFALPTGDLVFLLTYENKGMIPTFRTSTTRYSLHEKSVISRIARIIIWTGLVFPRRAPNEIKTVAVLKSALIMLGLRRWEETDIKTDKHCINQNQSSMTRNEMEHKHVKNNVIHENITLEDWKRSMLQSNIVLNNNNKSLLRRLLAVWGPRLGLDHRDMLPYANRQFKGR